MRYLFLHTCLMVMESARSSNCQVALMYYESTFSNDSMTINQHHIPCNGMEILDRTTFLSGNLKFDASQILCPRAEVIHVTTTAWVLVVLGICVIGSTVVCLSVYFLGLIRKHRRSEIEIDDGFE